MLCRIRKAIVKKGRDLWSQLRGRALILAYHRVVTPGHDPQLLCVSPENFKDHLEVISSRYNPCSLSRLMEHVKERTIPSRLVVITFDDGYADNFHNAKPLLQDFDIPGTVFISTGYVTSGVEFWWDTLERLLLRPRTLPEIIQIQDDKVNLRIELGTSAEYSERDFQQHRNWNVLKEYEPTPRHRYYKQLHTALLPLDHHRRQKILDKLMVIAGIQEKARESYRSLQPNELQLLAEGGLVEVGGHTVNHCHLSSLPRERQGAEIRLAKASLEEILGLSLKHFSYPYGSRHSYTYETIAEVRHAGFISACANFAGTVVKNTSRWELPRRLVRDWDGESFQRLLEEWFHA